MSLLKPEYDLETKDSFRQKIGEHFSKIADNQVPEIVLNAICDRVTNFQYDQNKRFWKQYPKSRKRYSRLKMEDLDHPFVHYVITDYLKPLTHYRKYAKILLQMNDEELDAYELMKHQYETK
jgi:hypothetical protein